MTRRCVLSLDDEGIAEQVEDKYGKKPTQDQLDSIFHSIEHGVEASVDNISEIVEDAIAAVMR